jgi:putative CocE/NonD family hydrolase
MRRALVSLLLCGLASWSAPSLAQIAERKVSALGEYRGYSTVLYTETLRSSVYFKLRDGTRLAMDIHRPAVAGQVVDTPYPVLWQHSLTRRRPPDQGDTSVIRRMPELVKHGYVVVEVERRGLGASFGARRGYHDRTEGRDAFEVTEWLARQPWSTGQVGVYGCSNTGESAMHAASYAPPSLKAVFAGCFSWNKFDGFQRGGVAAQWGLGPERPLDEQLRNAEAVDGDADRTLLRQAVEEHRNSTPLAEMWRSMPFRDSWSDIVGSRFWVEGSVSTYRDALRNSQAAFYIFGGWQDEFRREGLVAWANLKGRHARVTIGPWMHCRNPGFDLLAEAHRFFDRWLKGVDNGIDREPPVNLFAEGAPAATAWQSFAHWPPANATPLRRTLAISTQEADGEHALTSTASKQTRVDLPVRPMAACPDLQSLTQPCSQAANALRFTSEVLKADQQLTGHALADLWVASSQPDQSVFVYLEDLAPDGSATVVTEGRLKASLRATQRPPYDVLGLPWQRSLEADHEPLRAGEPVRLQFDLLPLSHLFKAGHRLRVVVSGNDPRQRPTAPTGHTLTLLSSADKASTLDLPLVPTR